MSEGLLDDAYGALRAHGVSVMRSAQGGRTHCIELSANLPGMPRATAPLMTARHVKSHSGAGAMINRPNVVSDLFVYVWE